LGDPPNILIKRFGMELMAQKTKCIMFRRYLGSNELKARKMCVSAALRCLKVQRMMEEARLPGGPLSVCPPQYFWDLMDSFLLATIIVGLELKAIHTDRATTKNLYTRDEHRVMIASIQLSIEMWDACNIASDKAKRAARALAKGLGGVFAAQPEWHNEQSTESPSDGAVDQQVLRAAWNAPGNGEIKDFDFNDFDTPETIDGQTNLPLDGFMNIDWGAWDSRMNEGKEVDDSFMVDADLLSGDLGINPFFNQANALA